MPRKPVDRDIAISLGPVWSAADFKTPVTDLAYDTSGLVIKVYREDLDNNLLVNTLTLTSNGMYDFEHVANGIYALHLPAANDKGFANNALGIMYAIGNHEEVLQFRSLAYDIEPQPVFDALSAGTDYLTVISSNLGTGPYATAITVNDGTSALEGARVRLLQGTESRTGTTDSKGGVTFGLDAFTWSVIITKPNYSFDPTTLVVNADGSATYSMSAQAFLPSDPDKVTGTLIAYSHAGVGTAGITFTIKPFDAATTTGLGLSNDPLTVTSGASGATSFTNLFPGITYVITRGSSTRQFAVEIPADVDTTAPYPLPSVIGMA
jgi:hypothetical protein